MEVTLITGNKGKAEYFEKCMGMKVEHMDVNLVEIQSLDLEEIAKHKVLEAYSIVKKPVMVEDTALEFEAFGKLPGPFIKFFLKEMPLEDICSLLNGKSRKSTAYCTIGYYDGINLKIFQGKLNGHISEKPLGENGFGWDKIFIPDGYDITRAQMNDEEYRTTYVKLKRFDLLKEFLETHNN